MIKKIISLSIIALLVLSCGNKGKKEVPQSAGGSESVKVEFASLIANPSDYIGKNISVEGKVVHVCTHERQEIIYHR